MAEQEIRFTTAGGRRVAWSAVGTGPTLVVGGWWCSHLQLDWDDPAFRWFVDQLSTRFTVIRYDRPGTGLSDRDGPTPPTLEDEVAVVDAVVRASGADRVFLLGLSSGGCVATRYAASHPGLVRRLVLYGTYAEGRELAPESARTALVSVVSSHWGIGSRTLADVFLPGATADEREAFARYQRTSATSENAAASLASVYRMDIRAELSQITAPTLVLHRRDDHTIAASLGRDVAARVAGSTFVLLEGVDHLAWRGDAGSLVAATCRFLGSPIAPPEPGTRPAALPPNLASLTDRELEVLRLVATGLVDDEIAGLLTVSPHTVHRHVANIRTKLGLASRAAAVAAAARAGLV